MRTLSVMLAGLTACTSASSSKPGPADASETPKISHRRVQVTGDGLVGASGLTERPGGGYWTVLERERRLYGLDISKDSLPMDQTLPIEGAPDGLDLEAVAVLDKTTLMFGTESTDSRSVDRILEAKIQDNRVVITDRSLAFDYTFFNLEPERNHGIESLCQCNGRLMAASEVVGETDDDKRYAPFGIYDVLQNRWSQHRLALTSDSGKISALACRPVPDATELFAIERHYGISRLLRYRIPLRQVLTDLPAEVLVDLVAMFGDDLPNFEGLASDGGDGLVLISDNDYGGTSGPTEILHLQDVLRTQHGHSGSVQ